MKTTMIALMGVGVLAAACTSTGNVERNAAGGAALGAIAGAVKGCREDGGCGATSVNRRQYYDERAGRYYYYDSRSGRYYWENGAPRS